MKINFWRCVINKKTINFAYYALIGISLIIFIQFAVINSTNSVSSSSLQGNLLIWYSPESNNVITVVNNTIKNLTKSNPDINILTELIPPNDNPSLFLEKARSGFGASALFMESTKIQELVAKKVIKTIDSEMIDTSIYSPDIINQVIYQKEIYGIPVAAHTKVLCYNKGKLSNTNDPILRNPPTNLDGLIERAIKGYSVGFLSGFENTFWGIGAFGGRLFNENGEFQPSFKGWAKWMDWLKNAYVQPNVIISADGAFLHNAFAQGKLAYYVCDSTEIVKLRESLQDNLRIALLPNGEGEKSTPILTTKVMVLNSSNTSNENFLALALAKYMTNPEQQLMGIINTHGFIPVNRNVNLNLTLRPIESVLLKQAESSITIPLNHLEKINDIFQKGEILYQKTSIGEISTVKAENELILFVEKLTQ